MRAIHLLAIASFAIAAFVQVAASYDEAALEKLLERAEQELEKDLFERTMSGARSPRFNRKKVTEHSRAFSKRNALFSKSMALLEADGLKPDEAKEVVRLAMRQRGKKQRRPSGQGGQTRPIDIVEDLCDGETKPDCSGYSSNFRSIDGRCNNENNPLWGSMSISMRRYLNSITSMYKLSTFTSKISSRSMPLLEERKRSRKGQKQQNNQLQSGQNNGNGQNSQLDDVKWFGLGEQRCSCSSSDCVDKAPVELPNARLVSTNFHGDDVSAADTQVTHMVTQMGQFLDHDITLTPEEEAHDCCTDGSDPNCLQIDIPVDDYFYKDIMTCQEFTRSTGFCEESANFDSPDHEQLNGITAFVDASNVYGSTDTVSNELRANDGTGKLKVQNNLLPILDATTGFEVAGDVRAREMPGLAVMHTVFVREHNRLCDALASRSDTSDYGDEDFFQNARRILIAEMQKIVYGEYLPVVMGSKAMREYDLELQLESRYDSSTDPSISNSFATAAYRFGHSMIQGLIDMYNTQTGNQYATYALSNNYFNMTNYHADNGIGMEEILMGLAKQSAQANDRHVSVEVTNKLFANLGTIPGVGADLVSRNIQRGRDHGLPSYAAFYKKFAPKDDDAMDCWDKRPKEIDSTNWNLLKTIYHHPHHIDLFVGGLAEKPFDGGLTGATFQGIKGKQFKDLKKGDRFFFTHKGNMKKQEYDEIMGRTFADIICDNTGIQNIPSNVFLLNSPSKSCSSSTNMKINNFNLYRN